MAARATAADAAKVPVHLAATSEPWSSIGDLVRTYDISHNNLMKVASEVRRAGFVEAVRGHAGGIRLSRPAREISLGELVRHLEKMVGFIDKAGGCGRPDALTDVFETAFGRDVAALGRYTVGDLTDGERVKE